MLARLVQGDLHERTRSILAVLLPTLIAVPFFGMVLGAQSAAGVLPMTMAMAMWTYNTRTAYEEDKAELWTYLRALPIPPRQIVAVRYLSTGLVTVGLTSLAVVAAYAFPFIPRIPLTHQPLAGAALAGLETGLLVSAFFNVVYYRLGYKAAVGSGSWTVMLVLIFGFFVVALLRDMSFSRSLAALAVRALAWSSRHSSGAAVLAVMAGGLVYWMCWAFSAAAFSRREFD